MRQFLLFSSILSLSTIFLFSSSQWPDPDEILTPEIIIQQMIENPCSDKILINYQPEEYTEDSRRTNQSPSVYSPLWGNDILVSGECEYSSEYLNLAFDYDKFGRLYVPVIDKFPDHDTLWIYCSTDSGQTWFRDWEITSINSNIIWYDMKVSHFQSTPEIFTFVIVDNGMDTTLWFRKISYYQNVYTWVGFSPNDTNFQNITKIAFDISENQDMYLYATYQKDTNSSENKLYRMISSDSGYSWTTTALTDYTSGLFDVASGPEGYFYITYNNIATSEIVLHRYQDYGSLIDIKTVSDSGINKYCPFVASARHHPWGTNYVYVVYQEGTAFNGRAKISTSSDGGDNWIIGETWSIIGEVNSRKPFVEFAYDNSQDHAIGFVTNYENLSLVVGLNLNHGGNWNSVLNVSDHAVSGEVPAQGNYIENVFGGPGAVSVYRQHGGDSIWVDREYCSTGIEEEISPILIIDANTNSILFSITLDQETEGKIDIVDITGRILENIYTGKFYSGENIFSWDYIKNNLNPGEYFVILNIPEFILTKKIILLR